MIAIAALIAGTALSGALGLSPRSHSCPLARRGSAHRPAGSALLRGATLEGQPLSNGAKPQRRGRMTMPKLADKQALGEVIIYFRARLYMRLVSDLIDGLGSRPIELESHT